MAKIIGTTSSLEWALASLTGDTARDPDEFTVAEYHAGRVAKGFRDHIDSSSRILRTAFRDGSLTRRFIALNGTKTALYRKPQ